MKRIFLATGLLSLGASLSAQTTFTQGNVVVLRVGDGTTTLSNAAFQTSLLEYTPTGTAGFSVDLPTTGSARLTNSGTGTSAGYLTRSTNGSKLVIPGYDAAAGTAGVTSGTADRVVDFVNNSGLVTRAGAGTNATTFTGDNIRSAVSDGFGSTPKVYAGGNAGTGNAGVRLLPASSGASTGISATTANNVRNIAYFNGSLYYSTGSGTPGIYQLGTGLPTITTAATAVQAVAGSSPYSFFFSQTGDSLFIADDRSTGTGGGIQFYSRASGATTYTLNFTINPATTVGQTVGARGLTGIYSGNALILFATTAETSNNRLVRVDLGASSGTTTNTLTASAGANYVFRGVALSPSASALPLSLLSFTAQRKGESVTTAWTTAGENQVRHMELQRSVDGVAYENIATLKALNTPGEHHYGVDDSQSLSGRSFYRLASVDYNGAVSYSQTVVVYGSSKGRSIALSVTPNPIERSFYLLHTAATAGARLVVTSLDGRILAVRQPAEGSNRTDFTSLDLPTGSYLATFENDGEKVTTQFVK